MGNFAENVNLGNRFRPPPPACQKMRGGKHVKVSGVTKHAKVKKRRRQDILRFSADARKQILGSIGTPLTT